MKILRTIISIAFVTGTIALILYDGQVEKKHLPGVKQDSLKTDSVRQPRVAR